MQDVRKYFNRVWPLFIGCVLFIVGFLAVNKLLVSCNNSVQNIAKNIDYGTQSRNVSEVEKILSRVESLEKKDSTIQAQIQKIDSLGNELRTVKLTVAEQYRFLSDRYANKLPKR